MTGDDMTYFRDKFLGQATRDPYKGPTTIWQATHEPYRTYFRDN